MVKEISKDDWGRKYWVNYFWMLFAIVSIVVGTRHWEVIGEYRGIFIVVVGALMLHFQINFLWDLKNEKTTKDNNTRRI